ncbi:MAG: Protease HtpX-like protein [Candidatus Uhrbacteria bacterium GW2011_GWE2_45_35]|uniref:Protease HtpX-like protein n=1 Tax=Candidatus Uhrbacteria bacterium GW2011_GWE2_45_35 TaxID=1618993 RepID=A0A0G1PPX5_9BACT|nr:MAG: Protease HtpX-like protein [Candidatus Uhrbacteria bacterium GW2011_GWE2_45_35]
MYSEIDSNKRKTTIFIVAFTAVIIGIGWVLGETWGEPSLGIIAAVIIATVMNLVAFYKGDSVALLTAGAKAIEKQENPELYNLVENLAITSGLPTPKIYIINDTSPNAFATGRDPEHASVAVTSGLLQIMTRQELEGVIAHEMSHVKNYDIRIMTLVVVLVGTVMLLSDLLMRSTMIRGRSNNKDAGQIQMVLFIVGLVLAILSPFLAELLTEGLASALEKIAKLDQPLKKASHATAHLYLANPFDPHVTKKFELWFSTHPPIEERIKRLRGML